MQIMSLRSLTCQDRQQIFVNTLFVTDFIIVLVQEVILQHDRWKCLDLNSCAQSERGLIWKTSCRERASLRSSKAWEYFRRWCNSLAQQTGCEMETITAVWRLRTNAGSEAPSALSSSCSSSILFPYCQHPKDNTSKLSTRGTCFCQWKSLKIDSPDVSSSSPLLKVSHASSHII